MYEHYSRSAYGAGNQAMYSYASNVNDLFLSFFGRDSFCFFSGTLHIFAANHSAWTSACHNCKINTEFLCKPPRRR
jgi:hypothetical protein